MDNQTHNTKVELLSFGYVVSCSICGRMFDGPGPDGEWWRHQRGTAEQYALTHRIRMEYASAQLTPADCVCPSHGRAHTARVNEASRAEGFRGE